MQIISSLADLNTYKKPAVVTIGKFDGVHLGHVTLLQRLVKVAQQTQSLSVVITFSNHPLELFNPDIPLCKLCTKAAKHHYIQRCGVDILLSLEFTKDIALKTAREFFEFLMQKLFISHVILGYDATVGRAKAGNPLEIQRIGNQYDFQVEYIPPCIIEGQPVSSSTIRQAIQRADFATVEALLGRKFSLNYPLQKEVCLPPPSDYFVNIKGPSIDIQTNARLDAKGLKLKPELEHLLLKEECEIFFN